MENNNSRFLMKNPEQISDCKCQGNNPNCSICDGKGYFYCYDNEDKSIKKAGSIAHILDLDTMGIPENVNKSIYEYEPVLKRQAREKGPKRNNKQDQKTKPSYPSGEKPVIKKSKDSSSKLPKYAQKNNVTQPPINLVQSFPEIEKFFKCDKFSQENLDELLFDLKIQYKDKKLYSTALAFVKLEQLKYKIEKEGYKHRVVSDTHKRVAKEINRPNKKLSPEIPKEILKLASFLEISNRSLIKYLEQKSIYKEESDVLDESELSEITPYVLSRLEALGRQSKRRLW